MYSSSFIYGVHFSWPDRLLCSVLIDIHCPFSDYFTYSVSLPLSSSGVASQQASHFAVQVGDADVNNSNKKGGGNSVLLEAMAGHDLLIFLNIYSDEQLAWVVASVFPPSVLLILLRSVPHTTSLVPASPHKESFVWAVHLAQRCRIES